MPPRNNILLRKRAVSKRIQLPNGFLRKIRKSRESEFTTQGKCSKTYSDWSRKMKRETAQSWNKGYIEKRAQCLQKSDKFKSRKNAYEGKTRTSTSTLR